MRLRERLEGRLIPTRFEKAYIRYYNGRITIESFLESCGIDGKETAWKELNDYRRRVLSGEIPDPRDRYRKWR